MIDSQPWRLDFSFTQKSNCHGADPVPYSLKTPPKHAAQLLSYRPWPTSPRVEEERATRTGKSGSIKRLEMEYPHAGRAAKTPNYMKPTASSDARKERSLVSIRSPNPNRSRDLHANLTKNPSLRKKCSPVCSCVNYDARRATCSSTLKDCKFPACLALNHGGTESEGTSAVRVCPYTYCSLNSYLHHDPLPPLKCFLSVKRAQRRVNLGCVVKPVGDGSVSERKLGMMQNDLLDEIRGESWIIPDEFVFESHENYKGYNSGGESNSCDDHVALFLGDTHEFKFDEKSEFSMDESLQELNDKGLNSDKSSVNMETSAPVEDFPVEEPNGCNKICDIAVEEDDQGRSKTTGKRKKPVEESEELGGFNPRGPNFLAMEPGPEAEKVDLRHQEADEKKNAEEWMVDYALRQAVTKLGPVRKRKVALLVEAFEKVIPIAKWEAPSFGHDSGFDLSRPIQACR